MITEFLKLKVRFSSANTETQNLLDCINHDDKLEEFRGESPVIKKLKNAASAAEALVNTNFRRACFAAPAAAPLLKMMSKSPKDFAHSIKSFMKDLTPNVDAWGSQETNTRAKVQLEIELNVIQ